MKTLLTIIIVLISINTVSAKGTDLQYRTTNTAITVSESARHTVSVRTYFLESKTEGTYKAFLQDFKNGTVTPVKGYDLVGTQFYKVINEVHELTELRPTNTNDIHGLTIQHF